MIGFHESHFCLKEVIKIVRKTPPFKAACLVSASPSNDLDFWKKIILSQGLELVWIARK